MVERPEFGSVSNLVGGGRGGGCRTGCASGQDVGYDVVRPPVGEVPGERRERQDRGALFASLDEPDFLAGSFAYAIFGLESVDLGRQFAVDSLERVELRLALYEAVILVEPGLDGEDDDRRANASDYEEREDPAEQYEFGSPEDAFLNRNRPGEVAES